MPMLLLSSRSRTSVAEYSKTRVRALTLGGDGCKRRDGHRLRLAADIDDEFAPATDNGGENQGAFEDRAEGTIVALSPWPTTPVALATATAALRAATGIGDDATAQRLGAVAAARVERFAPTAPQAICETKRSSDSAGYLRQQPSVIRGVTAGSVELAYAT